MEIRNNVQSPNFGMALIIKKNIPGVVEQLSELPIETIKALKEAGKIVGRKDEKDATQFYHVVVDLDKNGKLQARLDANSDAYFGPFSIKVGDEIYKARNGRGNHIMMLSKFDREPFAGVARYANEDGVSLNAWGYDAYNEVLDIKRLAEIAKILDQAAAEKAYGKTVQEMTIAAEKAQKSAEIGALVDTYGA